MAKKMLAIFGATGQQGSSIITHVLSDPLLSSTYQIRAITRDISSPKALTLSSKPEIEVVTADVTNPSTLLPALTGAHTIFAMTAHNLTTPNAEFLAGKAIADAAVSVGASYLIWSTLPSISAQTGGKYTLMRPFDEKFAVEEYIRTELHDKGLIKACFLLPGVFMENFMTGISAPKFDATKGKWVIKRANSRDSKLSMISAVEDTGKFMGSILAEPEKYKGRTVDAVQGRYSYRDIADAIGKGTGKEVVFEEVSAEEFKSLAGGGILGEAFWQLFGYFEEFGLYGSDEDSVVDLAGGDVRGGRESLIGLGEFFSRYPVKLEEE